MTQDELEEINGIKPKILLEDGKEHEVGSASSKAVYKIKRTVDHYNCNCPAWRNQKGAPVNARSCKHIKSLLGEAYENARLAMKNPAGAAAAPEKKTSAKKAPAKEPADKKAPAKKVPAKRKKAEEDEDEDEDEEEQKPKKKPAAKGKAKATPKSKGKAPAKRKKVADDENEDEDDDEAEDEDDVEEEEEEEKPKRKPVSKAKAAAKAKPASKVKPASKTVVKDDDAMDVDSAPTGDGGDDELASINGIKPLVWIPQGEEREVGSASSKSVYKVKHTMDHFYCTCPAWRNQSGRPVNARSCKHIKTLLGEEYEEARIQLKDPDGAAAGAGKGKAASKGRISSKATPASEAKPASKGKTTVQTKAAGKRKKPDADDEEEDRGEEEEQQAEEEASKPPAKKARISPVKEDDENEAAAEDEDGDEGIGAVDADELAEISGVKPKVLLADGEEREVKSQTSNSVYKIKRTWDHFYCTCPAWRNQGGVPVNARTCKHLQSFLGADYEAARLKYRNPDGPAPKSAKKAAGKRKKADDEDGDEDGDDDEEGGSSGKTVPGLLLANKWDIETGPDPTGWLISEKLDGVRTFYDGKQMISRLGNPFTPPQWFLDKLPKDVTLDGELFGGRGEFQSTVSIVKTINSPHWKGITFQIFDVPSRGTDIFEDRLSWLQKTFGEGGTHTVEQIAVVEHEVAESREHVLQKLKEVETLGGEGLMLRKPGSQYEGQRSATLLKIKTFYDAEAIVTGYVPGKGRNAGTTGALKCKMASGKTFNVGTGLSDKQRRNPPKVGAIIVYRFQELTRDGVPRFPSYIGEAADKDVPKDAEIPEHRKAGAGAKFTEE